MAGNIINMYGGSYVDVHDNEVVNLNIDKAEVSVRENGTDEAKLREQAAVLTSNEKFMAVMAKAEDQGLCSHEGWRFKWKEKIDAVYFASVASHRFNLSNRHDRDGDLSYSWKPFEVLFDDKGFRLTFNDYQNGKYKLPNKEKIDKLFR